jgi:hypothetical protein
MVTATIHTAARFLGLLDVLQQTPRQANVLTHIFHDNVKRKKKHRPLTRFIQIFQTNPRIAANLIVYTKTSKINMSSHLRKSLSRCYRTVCGAYGISAHFHWMDNCLEVLKNCFSG